MVGRPATALVILLAACSTPADDSESRTSGDVDENGYATHGEDLYPPLLRRVYARPCNDNGECRVDSDCGSGFACVCAPLVTGQGSQCLAAECSTDDDCGQEPCFLSAPGPSAAEFTAGLFCGRLESLCADGGDCPGNGTSCSYRPSSDRFECT